MSTEAGTIRTAFDRMQRDLGADFTEWEGWCWPNHFGDPAAEHRTVREAVGVWDESPLRKWDFSGPDALAAADRIFTNDMLGLEIGQVRYAPFCDENGKMVGDGTVFKFTEASAWVITALDSDLDHFQDVVSGMDVRIEPITDALPHVQLQGPGSRDLLAGLVDDDVESLSYFRFWPHQTHVGRVPCWVSRTGYSGELGYEIFCDPDHAEELWGVLIEAGAKPYGLAAVETLRIESGLIFIGYDYFQHETDPFDMSLDKVIRLDAGDFHGKEALAKTAKSPPRRMVTLEVEGDETPEYGAAVTKGGEPAGTLTSPCESPTLGSVVGMAVLEARLAKKGETVEVALADGIARATVADFPVYDPEKRRPRS
ncbi:MAG TPA: aminomethyltransferase family protein [Gaiellaceae bacterium]|jgi:aminomethyltransferase|nr:aminomethyltransferase family protein [Gaiellaceae bacterium]